LVEAFQRTTEAYTILNDADRRAAYDSILSISLDGENQKAVQARVLAREEEERRAAERRRRLFMSKGFAKLGAARKLYEEALAHIADGERGLAVEALKIAVQLDPQRKEIRDRIRELEAEQRKARAFFWFEQAKVAEVKDDWGAALRSYETGLQIDGRSGSGMLGAARAALEVRDFERSSSWAIRAVEYAPHAVEPKLILAQAEIGLGQGAKAKALLQSVLEANPDHKEARALLKSI
jgi:curved DNA-binding protein CbpA